MMGGVLAGLAASLLGWLFTIVFFGLLYALYAAISHIRTVVADRRRAAQPPPEWLTRWAASPEGKRFTESLSRALRGEPGQ